jgi:sterol desaturase/sphingolipid hydroxylase (fatty acid hydroxylase superfamily)
MQHLIDYIINEAPYWIIFVGVTIQFLLMYFVLGSLFLKVFKFLESKGIANKIHDGIVSKSQRSFEIKHSIVSILIFGLTAIPLIYMIRNGQVDTLSDTVINVLGGVIFLTVWNELHFFLVHRTLHTPWLMKRVHYIHHRSKTPTIESVYSFHWLEATLLSAVPLTYTLFFPIAPLALVFYPVASILINFAGHCNYRIGDGSGPSWKLFVTKHNNHHVKGRGTFGFATDIFDKILTKISRQ